MAIRIVSGLRALVTDVRAYFVANSVTATVSAGFRARFSQVNQGPGRANRVVFLPGDPKTGAGGALSEPQSPGFRDIPNPNDPTKSVGSVRTLADWRRQVFVSVWSFDEATKNDDAEQQFHAEDLLEWTIRAIVASGRANAELGAVTWVPATERQFGAEALLALTLTHPLFDVPFERAYPENAAVTKDPPA